MFIVWFVQVLLEEIHDHQLKSDLIVFEESSGSKHVNGDDYLYCMVGIHGFAHVVLSSKSRDMSETLEGRITMTVPLTGNEAWTIVVSESEEGRYRDLFAELEFVDKTSHVSMDDGKTLAKSLLREFLSNMNIL